ncbi:MULTISPECIES: hypothetical protein [unclassified Bradyrhizobium]|uniref:hypothetical protein n=1 Tax=unclassified Bradyrhizobium TaxID=2631580 RepID=UPI001FF83A32|nr:MULTISPECIES: hypothetical protein [unclassified Bradyrhizobium]
MNYTGLRWIKDDKQRQRIVAGLSKLRTGLKKKVPAKSDGTLLLATWNIREFGGTKYGGRTTDAMYYIAECISRFDLIAVQEVRADLKALKEILRLLGRQWDVIFTDVSFADGGNFERLAFVYNTAKVSFTGLAGELVLPSKTATERMSQVARTPFVCGFQVGWAKFNLCTVHIYYGTAKAEDLRRVDEINALAKLLATKAKDYINTSAPADSRPNTSYCSATSISFPAQIRLTRRSPETGSRSRPSCKSCQGVTWTRTSSTTKSHFSSRR